MSYRKGYNLERDVRKYLEERGFFCIRSAGSHGIVDVVAFGQFDIYLIQCKNSCMISHEEWNELMTLSRKWKFTFPIFCHKETRKGIQFYLLTDFIWNKDVKRSDKMVRVFPSDTRSFFNAEVKYV